MMSSKVSVQPRTGQSGSGAPTYGDAVTYDAHLSRKRRLVRTLQGEEVVSSQAAYLCTNVDIQPTARVTLSTGDVGSTEDYALHPPLVSVERRFDQTGPHSTVLFME